MLDDEDALIICNGYKDEEYVETALLASKLGRTVILVVEKASELKLIADISKRMGVKPRIGMRAKLSSRGSGRWEASGGDRSKFGLTSREMIEAIEFLKQNDLLGSMELLHFHLGSQISAIRSLKNAMREAGRFFVELHKMGAPLNARWWRITRCSSSTSSASASSTPARSRRRCRARPRRWCAT
jgi:arginine decarboxylase